MGFVPAEAAAAAYLERKVSSLVVVASAAEPFAARCKTKVAMHANTSVLTCIFQKIKISSVAPEAEKLVANSGIPMNLWKDLKEGGSEKTHECPLWVPLFLETGASFNPKETTALP